MKITFCCTGNTCRSPMAEQMLRYKLNIAGVKGVEIDSCGVMCSVGDSMNSYAQQALKKLGIIPTKHFSKPISQQLLNDSDIIICMTSSHREFISQSLGNSDKIKDINQLVGQGDINDPFGGCLASYALCARVISENLDRLMSVMKLIK